MDRISNLPDDIIHHIGSFLSAKECCFRYSSLKTLASRVRKFSLKCKHEAQYEDLINRCLRHVTVSTMKLGSDLLIEALPAGVFLPALKSLLLDSVRFFGVDDGRCTFKTLLSVSPVLQELVMNGNEWERWKWCCTVSSTTLIKGLL
ncbi:hypothetical protein HID58_070953 [Brassica napus]|uniref:F-box domain-containing protein n=1 Tax=Brassica napus TaxID=3708 RepID=A0ABQ7Z0A9_BRANA|nr:hypothetical protein HID58_070953 [Brassica napus]